jgi:Eco57I restriction-modification methylase
VSETDKLLPALLQNVVGFDLNPLAVISSRANFLLAVADLLKNVGEPIELPIYLADSIVLPAEGQGDTLYSTPKGVFELPLRGVNKQFLVPEVLATRSSLNSLARVLRHDIENEVSTEAFLQRCQSELGLSQAQWDHCESHLRTLYRTLSDLHKEGRNGLWADIARNMFMPLFIPQADFVVGNPPWVNFESLPQHYRDRSRPIWEHYGLFVHEGMEAILGKGKKDVSTLLTYVAADLYLKPRGKLAFVITQSVFKTSGAAQGFRRFVIPPSNQDHNKKLSTVPLRILQVDDFSSMQPFEGATNRTAAFVMQKGTPNRYPVDYTVWKKTTSRNVPFKATLLEAIPLLKQERLKAKPVDQRDETSAWITVPAKALNAVNKVLGSSDYRAFAGAYSGGANAVYWLEVLAHNQDGTVRVHNITDRAKREIRDDDHDLEPDLLYPLLRGREVHKWGVYPEHSARFLMVQDTQTRRGIPERHLSKDYPRTMAYFKRYRKILESRAAYKRYFKKSDPFYSMFNVAEYTFAPIKVVWAEQGAFGCAVVTPTGDRTLIPDHKIMLIPFDDEQEAHYLCGLANSSVFGFAVSAYSINIQQDPHVFQNVRIPKFDRSIENHRRLAQLSRRAHEVVLQGELGELHRIEEAIDVEAAKVWGLTPQELKAIDEILGRA